ncbi:hypothetical protein HK096_007099, partial [Nowakowskiella sp. JEL0078]
MSHFRIPIESNPLQLYRSALLFCPTNTVIRLVYSVENMEYLLGFNIPKVISGLDSDWGACITIFEGHTNAVWSVSFLPDGTTIASGSFNNTVHVWDVRSGMSQVFKGHTNYVCSVSFLLDWMTIASGLEDNTVHVWDVRLGTSQVFKGHTNAVFS